ncbi:MAG: sodium-translocating pyrophosphatase [Treponema sp.]|nr:sodium-translocating pyrophosphatase [Treponema sp.]
MIEQLFIIAPVGAVFALLFAFIQARKIYSFPEGSDLMKRISQSVRTGANAYLKRQYTGVALFFVVMFIILGIMAFAKLLTPFVPFAFISGGIISGLSGFIGMKIATAANARTAHASSYSLNKGLKVAFSAGSVMGFTVVGLGVLFLSIWFLLLKYVFFAPGSEAILELVAKGFTVENAQIQLISSTMLTCGMGASSMALFARVGGGIFTKAADVGADLVGKVEAGIPEDDPRNPAVIADNVGDNVGDVAGMGADLYESYTGSIVATMALAVSAGYGFGGAIVPMIMAAAGIVSSIIGALFVRSGEKTDQRHLLAALRKGTYISSALIIILAVPIVYFCLDCANHGGFTGPRFGVYWAILSGLLAGVLIGMFTEYYTSDSYKPTKNLAHSSLTGPATLIIGGISLGMISTAIPVIIVGTSVLVSFYASGGGADPETLKIGLYGVAISAVGMLSTLGITLATDAYGPIADNAGAIAELSHLPEEVRKRTDALDALGNTTAAIGKGFAIGSAALTALALIVAFIDEIVFMRPDFIFNLSITNPPVLIGLMVGVMLPFMFSSMTMNAVGRAAQQIVIEVRRQFKEIAGLMEGTAEPDYATCVDICTKSAQKEMIMPALMGILSPVVFGLILGVNGIAGMLAGATASGFVLAIMMANSGGSWDNAKKHIEGGAYGGKGSDPHKAAVVGDTVGDPFKDTSGPSINILIKLMSMVAIVFAGLILNYSIFK